MQKDENHDAGASGLPTSPLDHDASSGGFQPSAKLRDMLEKLAKWRIDQSSIEFPEDAPEFRGGNATVVKGFLASPSCGEDKKDHSDVTRGKSLDPNGPEGETSRRPKPVAVKKMNISDDRAKVLGLTLREAGFLVDLSHGNIIKLGGFVEDLSKEIIWLVFPWEENGTLRDFIASAEWEIPERISLIYDVAQGVEYLHSRTLPIRHGDLKSINVLVNSKCRAVITDFGAARRLVAKDMDKETSQTENTGIPQAALSLEATFCSSTNTMGITLTGDNYTLRWAPPEVLREEEPCLGSDIWAVGWVAYEVMTNAIPFQDVVKDAIVIKRVIQGDLPSITDHARMSLIQALCSLMLACWNIDPRKRPTAEDCRKSLRWMPRIIPNPIRTAEAAALRARSPALLAKLGDMHRRQRDYTNAFDFYTNALGSYRDIGDKGGESTAPFSLAQISTDADDINGIVSALLGLGEVHRHRKEYSQAVTFYSEALQIRTDTGDRKGRASVLSGLAELHRAQKEYGKAITFYSDALQIQTDFNDRRGRAQTLRGLAEIHRHQNQYGQAITLSSEALDIATDIGDRYGRARALLNLADAHRDQGNYSDAIGPYTQATEIYQQIGRTQSAAFASRKAAEVRRLLEREEVA